jgi:hypothetical protein
MAVGPFLIGGAALLGGAALANRHKAPGRAHFVPIDDDSRPEPDWLRNISPVYVDETDQHAAD